MQDPTVAKRLSEIGADVPSAEQRTPEALAKLVSAEVDKWVPLIQAAGPVAQ
jgi:tripartite-type tricarboxylate transporter receptor subunit TctC